ncbi:MAG: DUF2092 domain-containing protein [Pseudomonadota bacterium]|nr:MAG: DUF2092 domain-containing protein [Pseudomonadota bacterium]
MTQRIRRSLAYVLATLCVLLPAHAADKGGTIEPQADSVLKAMSDYLKNAKQFTFRSQVTYDQVRKSGQKITYGRIASVAIRRPNRLHAETAGDLQMDRIWYDGERFTMLDLRQNVYSTVEVPSTIDKALDFMVEKYGVVSPIADVVQSNPYPILVSNVNRGEYLGLHSVRGTRCHHLAFTQDTIDWQIWVEDSGTPAPRKIVITYKNVKSAPQFTAYLEQWDFSPNLSKNLFTFTPPAGALKTDMAPLMEAPKGK